MKTTKNILLLNHSGNSHSDIQLLLRVAGHQVQYFNDDLIAVNRYRMVLKTRRAFDLVILVSGDQQADLDSRQLTECFERLLLIDPLKAEIYLCDRTGSSLLGHHLEDLLEIITTEPRLENELGSGKLLAEGE